MDVNWSTGWTDLRKFYDRMPKSSSHLSPTTVIGIQAITRLHKASQAFHGRMIALGVMSHMQRRHCSCKSRLPSQPRVSLWTSQIQCLRLLRYPPCMETSFHSSRLQHLIFPWACNRQATLTQYNPVRRLNSTARLRRRLSLPVLTSRRPPPRYRQLPPFPQTLFDMLL